MAKYYDEYSDIYEQYENSGFEFRYNKRLGDSTPILKDYIDKIDPSKRNHDDVPLFVKCARCGDNYMDFIDGATGELDGKWVCHICGASVKERTVYDKLERENEAWEKEYDEIYNEDFDDFC